jgi:uncharacterized protein (TIGR01244 family)
MNISDVYHYIKIDEQISTAGQPTEAQLREAAGAGFTTVINLAMSNSDNALPDEAGLVRSLGMAYYHIPVAWDNPTVSDFERFDALLGQLPAGKTLIHCAANFRVTAFYSLYAQKRLGWSETQAEEFRAAIWQGSNYPVWERFVAEMRRSIADPT